MIMIMYEFVHLHCKGKKKKWLLYFSIFTYDKFTLSRLFNLIKLYYATLSSMIYINSSCARLRKRLKVFLE